MANSTGLTVKLARLIVLALLRELSFGWHMKGKSVDGMRTSCVLSRWQVPAHSAPPILLSTFSSFGIKRSVIRGKQWKSTKHCLFLLDDGTVTCEADKATLLGRVVKAGKNKQLQSRSPPYACNYADLVSREKVLADDVCSLHCGAKVLLLNKFWTSSNWFETPLLRYSCHTKWRATAWLAQVTLCLIAYLIYSRNERTFFPGKQTWSWGVRLLCGVNFTKAFSGWKKTL